MHRRYFLDFTHGRGRGVHEHFFHFMWGYLMPAASAILDVHSARPPGEFCDEFIFISCGPVMDARTDEMARLFGVTPTIVEDEREARRSNTIRVALPRWDSFFCDDAQYARLGWGGAFVMAVRQTARERTLPAVVWSHRQLRRKIRRVRAAMLERVGVRPGGERRDGEDRRYYILKRSEEPAYYNADSGAAQEPTYGTSRRSLQGIERAADALTAGSCTVGVFEPGAHSLADQIRMFNGCQGVIALRGAELANVVWLEPTSRVVIISAGTFVLTTPPAWALARLLGIDCVQIDWTDDPHPVFTDALIDRVRGHLQG